MKRTLSLLSFLSLGGLLLSVGSSPTRAADATDGANGTGTAPVATSETSGGTSSNEGAFNALSPGGQKISRALFDVQKQPVPDGTGTTDGAGTTEGPQPLSLDDIAAAKASGTGWGQIFKDMKAEGLVAEKNLGQVVSGANRRDRLGVDNGSGTGTDPGTDVSGAGASGTSATSTSATSAVRPVSPSGHRTKSVAVTLGNGSTVVTGGSGRGHGLRSGDTSVKSSGIKANSDSGHGNKGSIGAGNAGRDAGLLFGNGAAVGNSGSTAAAGGVSNGGGRGNGANQGSGKGRGH